MSPRSQPYTSFCLLPLFSSAEAKMENHHCNKTEMFFTAQKRSCLKEMFLHLAVILFIGESLSNGRGVSVQGGFCPGAGSLSRSGVSVQEWGLCPGVGSLSRGVSVQGGASFRETPPRLIKSRQYASYRNVFFFLYVFTILFEINLLDYLVIFVNWSA